MTTCIVTVSPPTPNGDLHLGHMAGPFLAGDVAKRIAKREGLDTIFVTYSDDYQSYAHRKAREEGSSHSSLVVENRNKMLASLAMVDIHFDSFMQASQSENYSKWVAELYRRCVAAGAITDIEQTVPYCEHCQVYGYEAYARGTCNECGAPSDASQCEECACAPNCELMGTFTCTLCNEQMAAVTVNRKCLNMKIAFDLLSKLYKGKHHRKTLERYLKEHLPQLKDTLWPIDRPAEHGIPIADDTQLHTWFSGLAGYIAATEDAASDIGQGLGKPAAEIAGSWFAQDTKIVHFFGYDCSFSHAIVYPTLLCLDENHPTELYHYTNRFLKLDHTDFSTSRGHAIWIKDFASKYPSDAIRLFLASIAPEEAVANFSETEFLDWYNSVYLPLVDFSDQNLKPTNASSMASFVRSNSYSLGHILVNLPGLENFSLRKYYQQILIFYKTLINKKSDSERNAYWLLFLAYMLIPIAPRLAKNIIVQAGLTEQKLSTIIQENMLEEAVA